MISRRETKGEESQSCFTVECVENSQNSSSKKIIEVKDRWVKARVTMDSGAAGHVTIEGMFARVNLERETAPKKFVAANGEQVKDLGEETIPFKTNLTSIQKVAGIIVVLDEKNPHIRNSRDGTMIKLDANSGVRTVDIWICLNRSSLQLAGTSVWSGLFRQAWKTGIA